MSLPDTNIAFNSNWDIDQLSFTNSISIGSGLTALYTLDATLPSIPVFEVQFKPTGSTRWFNCGVYATADTLATQDLFFTYIQSGVIYINTSVAGTARYFVWQDKVNY